MLFPWKLLWVVQIGEMTLLKHSVKYGRIWRENLLMFPAQRRSPVPWRLSVPWRFSVRAAFMKEYIMIISSRLRIYIFKFFPSWDNHIFIIIIIILIILIILIFLIIIIITVFRECVRKYREQTDVHHHWVIRKFIHF